MRSLGSGLCGGDIFVSVDVDVGEDDDDERTSFDERLIYNCRLPLSGQMRIPDSFISLSYLSVNTVTFLGMNLMG